MKTEEEKDEQLIKWLEGELSGSELSAFESSAEFDDYNRIINTTDQISYPKMDEEKAFSNIQSKISSNSRTAKPETKVIPLKRWILAIASIAVLAFAVISILPNSVNVTSDVGQFVAHTLPDGSEVNLNGNSQINYKNNFEDKRILQLQGEAFFDVQKGESFEVETDIGTVSVLGTSFNVFSREGIFVVACKTGKVKVEAESNSYVLEKGENIRIEKGSTEGKGIIEDSKIGNWVNGETYFSKASLREVVLSLSSVYNSDILLPSSLQNEKYTGSFVHNDFQKALKMVFSPMGISYSIDDQGNVLFSE